MASREKFPTIEEQRSFKTRFRSGGKTGGFIGGWSRGVVCPDNARPHAPRVKKMELNKFKWGLDHPPHSPAMRGFPSVWCTEKTLERKVSTDEYSETVGLISSQPHKFLGTRNPAVFHHGVVVLRPMVYILNKVYICTHRVVSYLFI
ncbi:hypothetical protein TNIN_233771 [Trichonephila inaurata madagascariensis]|uniref:Uncharacterized protein n=1 Tax=Trichonephila inaurata madagascariensis TaxID=2747483 RepID=A0A8X6XWI6_9ARAC|nr:hypothetical protein TNIN_233771 [Trichonephila inaurata madagascariensis]